MHREQIHDKETGALLLADISGFDAYLVDVELEHARDVTAELLELIEGSLQPPMHVAGIQQDAVLAYETQGEVARGEALLELIETTYDAFRDRLKSITRNNTCGCRACSAIPMLDLKFLAHYGDFTLQRLENGRAVLGGQDADLVRERLIKDQVTDGSRSYALFTRPSLAHMGLQPREMIMNSGTYAHLGQIETGHIDLGRRYELLHQIRRTVVSAEDADVIVSHDYAFPPRVVWDWLNDPYKRTRWFRGTTWRPGKRPNGRTGVGAVNHCTHGAGQVIETIVDWRPYDYFTTRMEPASGSYSLLGTYQLQPAAGGQGTVMTLRLKIQKMPALKLSRPIAAPILRYKLGQDFRLMGALITAEEPAAAAG